MEKYKVMTEYDAIEYKAHLKKCLNDVTIIDLSRIKKSFGSRCFGSYQIEMDQILNYLFNVDIRYQDFEQLEELIEYN